MSRSLPTDEQWDRTFTMVRDLLPDVRLKGKGHTILEHARLAGRGYPTASMRPGGGGTSNATDDNPWTTPVERAAMAERPDPDEVVLRLARRMFEAACVMVGAHDHLMRLLPARAQERKGQEDAHGNIVPFKAGAGDCEACGEFCTGDGNDRRRSGWCPACLAAWARADKPDRGMFAIARKRQADDRRALDDAAAKGKVALDRAARREEVA